MKRILTSLVVAVFCMPATGFAEEKTDKEELLALIEGLRAQIDAIQLTPGPPGPTGAVGPAGSAGPADTGGGGTSFEYVGTAGTLFQGSGGLGDFSRACGLTFPGSRMCTSEEVIKTVNPPQALGASDLAWVHPILLINLGDFSGVSTEGLSGQLSCDGWSRADNSGGLAMALDNGTFLQFTCSAQLDVACCAPLASQ